jgi:hypothetical protein
MATVEEWVRLWNESHGTEDFSRKTGLKYKTIQARNTRYRRAGLELKRFKLPKVDRAEA